MTIPLKPFKTTFDSLSASANDSFEVARIAGASEVLENLPNHAVPTVADLPTVGDNTGRIVYVESNCRYYYSNGVSWTTCYNPPPPPTGEFMYAFGTPTCGALGNGTSTVFSSSPTEILGGICNWLQVCSNGPATIALTDTGSIYTWGSDEYGTLGHNTCGVSTSSPVSITGGFTDWCYVSSSALCACLGQMAAIRTNGTLWTWGFGLNAGSLGINDNAARSSPVEVCGGFTDWAQVANTHDFMIARRANGSVYTWGSNSGGSLGINVGYGYGLCYSASSPVSISGGFTDWDFVAAGGRFPDPTVAAIRNGSLYTWGANTDGALGIGTGCFTYGSGCSSCSAFDQSSPVSVCGGFTDWCTVSAGESRMHAIRTNGSLYSWGKNYFFTTGWSLLGDGDGSTPAKCSPVSVAGGFTDWCAVSGTGLTSTFGIRTNGTLWTWGLSLSAFNVYLGTDAEVPVTSPVLVRGGYTDWCAVNGIGGYGGMIGIRSLV